jgi:hypothetical protein
MKKKYIAGIVAVLLLGVAAFTNPGIDKHREAVRHKLSQVLQQTMQDKMGDMSKNQLANAFASVIGNAVIEQVLKTGITSGNYVFFSTTVFTWQGKSQVIGIGLFGKVVLTKNLDHVMQISE